MLMENIVHKSIFLLLHIQGFIYGCLYFVCWFLSIFPAVLQSGMSSACLNSHLKSFQNIILVLFGNTRLKWKDLPQNVEKSVFLNMFNS